MLFGFVEEIEVGDRSTSTGKLQITLRHRDPGGKLYTVMVQARRLVNHDLEITLARGAANRLFRFPKLELAAFMDGDASHPDEQQPG